MSAQFVGRSPRARWFAGTRVTPALHGAALYRCAACNFLQRSPLLAEDAYGQLYRAAVDRWAQPHPRPDQVRIKDYIQARHPAPASILDIGCSSGDFLKLLGPAYSKYGVEPSLTAAENAQTKGIAIVAASTSDFFAQSSKYRVITAIDVIEHVPEPLNFLLKCAEHLEEGGEIIVSTGNADASAWRVIGPSYYYCHNFEHISFISPAWCKAAAVAGLQCEVLEGGFRHTQRPKAVEQVNVKKVLRTAVEYGLSSLERLTLMQLPGESRRLGPWFSVGEPGIFRDHFLVSFRPA